MGNRNPNKLVDHPLNKHVLGDDVEVDEVFLADVKARGVQNPIQILPGRRKTTGGKLLPTGTVICGHRRLLYAIRAGLKSVPVVVRDDLTDPLEIELVLLKDNDPDLMRTMTTEQRVRRGMALEDREKLRRLVTKSGEDFDGQVRPEEVAAKHVGMSRTSFRAGKVAVEAIDIMQEKGHTRKAERVRETLNRSASAAARAVSPKQPKKKPVTPRSAIVAVEQALRGVTKLVQKADEAHGGRSVHSRAVVAAITNVKGKLKEWKADLE